MVKKKSERKPKNIMEAVGFQNIFNSEKTDFLPGPLFPCMIQIRKRIRRKRKYTEKPVVHHFGNIQPRVMPFCICNFTRVISQDETLPSFPPHAP